MASTIFHHWLDQFHAWPKPRQRWVRASFVGLVLVVVFVLGVLLGRGLGSSSGLGTRAGTLAARNAALQSQVQSLEQQQKTATTTLAALRATMASRDTELQKLKQEQTFYAKLIGIDGDRSGLGVHSIALKPVAGTSAWNFVATLVNTAKNADAARGTLTLAVQGVRAGNLVTVKWAQLADGSHGLPFAFKFFQQVSGSFVLPKHFVPDHVVITLHPRGGHAITRDVPWHEAVAGHGIALTTP